MTQAQKSMLYGVEVILLYMYIEDHGEFNIFKLLTELMLVWSQDKHITTKRNEILVA